MSNSPLLDLPYIAAAQAQKHVTVNEAISILDGLVHLAFASRSIAIPPATPTDGDRYLVAASPAGDWSGHAGDVALRMEGTWRFFNPVEGWRAWISDENLLVTFDGAAWVSTAVPTSLQNMTSIGINATADTTNRLSVNSSAILFNNQGSGVQIKVNKNLAVDTASFLFQTGFSGRAEIGTTGDDNFHFKVSANGSSFSESITIAGATGLVNIANTAVLTPQPADPASPTNGQIWYNSTSGKFRGRQNSATVDLIGSGGGAASWGTITGTLSAQTDLQNALAAKLDDTQASAFGLALLDDADAPTARATMGLGTAATQASTAFAAASHTHTSAAIIDFGTASDARIAASSIDAHTDVNITAPAPGQVLKYNGTNWINDTDATSAGGGGQASIQFRDEGVDLGTAGTVDTLNVLGPYLQATRSGQSLTLASASPPKIALWQSPGSTITMVVDGVALALGSVGTATTVTPTGSSNLTQQKRLEYLVTVAATTAVAGWRPATGSAHCWRGNGAGLGGFQFRCRWGNATGGATATNRAFAGLAASQANPTDVEPSTQVNMIGMGWDAADTNVQLMSNDNTGVATKIDLGAAFPVPTTDRSALYQIELSCASNAASIEYKVTNLITGAVAQGTVTTDLPQNTAFMGPRGYMSVGGTSSVIGITFVSCEIITDY